MIFANVEADTQVNPYDGLYAIETNVPRYLADQFVMLTQFIQRYSDKPIVFNAKCITPWVGVSVDYMPFPNSDQYKVQLNALDSSAVFQHVRGQSVVYSTAANKLMIYSDESTAPIELVGIETPITFMWMRDLCLAESRYRDYKISGLIKHLDTSEISNLRRLGIPECAVVRVRLTTDSSDAIREFASALGLYMCDEQRSQILDIIDICQRFTS